MASVIGAINQKIAQTQATIQRLRDELVTLEAAKQLLEYDRPARVNIPHVRKRIIRPRPIDHPRKGILGPNSDAGMAKAILADAGKPTQIDRILDGIESKFGRRPNKASLVGGLSRYSKRRQHFYRTNAPNTFGLLEWRNRPEKG